MRYDRLATFNLRVDNEPQYDPVTGEWDDPTDSTAERMVWCYDMRLKEVLEIFGRQDVRGITLSHQGEALDAETVELDGVTYKITGVRQLRNKATYVAYSERPTS